ncbi:GxxExxY protein [Flavobacterium psychrotrophum]|uniref:GxxExxY protein n=1 Tax=Flavobacterium psychrotrophum TaxID=2294119 RepID=UPI000E31AB09|nr:GxxExxY protein [Flavobacterium psychrotrophum]
MINKKYLDELTYQIVGAAIEVHKIMGKGLLENVYHQCLKEELLQRNINFMTEMQIPVVYKGKLLNIDFRCDLLIEQCIVVELKSVNEMTSVFDAQLLTYMKLLKCPKGILINFNCNNIFKEGQKTLVNEFFSVLP